MEAIHHESAWKETSAFGARERIELDLDKTTNNVTIKIVAESAICAFLDEHNILNASGVYDSGWLGSIAKFLGIKPVVVDTSTKPLPISRTIPKDIVTWLNKQNESNELSGNAKKVDSVFTSLKDYLSNLKPTIPSSEQTEKPSIYFNKRITAQGTTGVPLSSKGPSSATPSPSVTPSTAFVTPATASPETSLPLSPSLRKPSPTLQPQTSISPSLPANKPVTAASVSQELVIATDVSATSLELQFRSQTENYLADTVQKTPKGKSIILANEQNNSVNALTQILENAKTTFPEYKEELELKERSFKVNIGIALQRGQAFKYDTNFKTLFHSEIQPVIDQLVEGIKLIKNLYENAKIPLPSYTVKPALKAGPLRDLNAAFSNVLESPPPSKPTSQNTISRIFSGSINQPTTAPKAPSPTASATHSVAQQTLVTPKSKVQASSVDPKPTLFREPKTGNRSQSLPEKTKKSNTEALNEYSNKLEELKTANPALTPRVEELQMKIENLRMPLNITVSEESSTLSNEETVSKEDALSSSNSDEATTSPSSNSDEATTSSSSERNKALERGKNRLLESVIEEINDKTLPMNRKELISKAERLVKDFNEGDVETLKKLLLENEIPVPATKESPSVTRKKISIKETPKVPETSFTQPIRKGRQPKTKTQPRLFDADSINTRNESIKNIGREIVSLEAQSTLQDPEKYVNTLVALIIPEPKQREVKESDSEKSRALVAKGMTFLQDYSEILEETIVKHPEHATLLLSEKEKLDDVLIAINNFSKQSIPSKDDAKQILKSLIYEAISRLNNSYNIIQHLNTEEGTLRAKSTLRAIGDTASSQRFTTEFFRRPAKAVDSDLEIEEDLGVNNGEVEELDEDLDLRSTTEEKIRGKTNAQISAAYRTIEDTYNNIEYGFNGNIDSVLDKLASLLDSLNDLKTSYKPNWWIPFNTKKIEDLSLDELKKYEEHVNNKIAEIEKKAARPTQEVENYKAALALFEEEVSKANEVIADLENLQTGTRPQLSTAASLKEFIAKAQDATNFKQTVYGRYRGETALAEMPEKIKNATESLAAETKRILEEKSDISLKHQLLSFAKDSPEAEKLREAYVNKVEAEIEQAKQLRDETIADYQRVSKIAIDPHELAKLELFDSRNIQKTFSDITNETDKAISRIQKPDERTATLEELQAYRDDVRAKIEDGKEKLNSLSESLKDVIDIHQKLNKAVEYSKQQVLDESQAGNFIYANSLEEALAETEQALQKFFSDGPVDSKERAAAFVEMVDQHLTDEGREDLSPLDQLKRGSLSKEQKATLHKKIYEDINNALNTQINRGISVYDPTVSKYLPNQPWVDSLQQSIRQNTSNITRPLQVEDPSTQEFHKYLQAVELAIEATIQLEVQLTQLEEFAKAAKEHATALELANKAVDDLRSREIPQYAAANKLQSMIDRINTQRDENTKTMSSSSSLDEYTSKLLETNLKLELHRLSALSSDKTLPDQLSKLTVGSTEYKQALKATIEPQLTALKNMSAIIFEAKDRLTQMQEQGFVFAEEWEQDFYDSMDPKLLNELEDLQKRYDTGWVFSHPTKLRNVAPSQISGYQAKVTEVLDKLTSHTVDKISEFNTIYESWESYKAQLDKAVEERRALEEMITDLEAKVGGYRGADGYGGEGGEVLKESDRALISNLRTILDDLRSNIKDVKSDHKGAAGSSIYELASGLPNVYGNRGAYPDKAYELKMSLEKAVAQAEATRKQAEAVQVGQSLNDGLDQVQEAVAAKDVSRLSSALAFVKSKASTLKRLVDSLITIAPTILEKDKLKNSEIDEIIKDIEQMGLETTPADIEATKDRLKAISEIPSSSSTEEGA